MSALDDAERARIKGNIDALREQCPEFEATFKELFAEGMVGGWRAIDYVGPHRPSPDGAITLEQVQIGPFNPAAAPVRL